MISSDVKEILENLRALHLNWIAEEIEVMIWAGRTIEKSYTEGRNRRSKRALATQPYNVEEEQAICLETLKAYFVDLNEIWRQTQSEFSEAILSDEPSETFSIELLDEENQIIKPFEPHYSAIKTNFGYLLAKARESIETEKSKRWR